MDSDVCSLTFLDTCFKSPEDSRHFNSPLRGWLVVLFCFGNICLMVDFIFLEIIFHNSVKLF